MGGPTQPWGFPATGCRGLSVLSAVSEWANGQNYEPAAVAAFLQVSDYDLVSQAYAGEHTVVTHEVPSTSTKQIKVPNVCLGIGVKCMTTYEMLRTERARFVLAQSA